MTDSREGKEVKVTLYIHKGSGEPMFDYGFIVVKEGVEYVTFENYRRYREGIATSHLIPLDRFPSYELI